MKLTTVPITNATTQSGVNIINNNFSAVEDALENTLSRNGVTPNQMEADIDLNSNDLLNVGNLQVNTIAAIDITVNGVPVEDLVGPPGPTGPQGPQGPAGQDGTGTGDFVGPASSVADNIVVFNGTTGKLGKDGGATIASLSTTTQINGASDVAFADADFVPARQTLGGALIKRSWLNIKSAIFTALGGLLVASTAKTTPIDADVYLIADTAASNATKQVTHTNAWTNYFKLKADALYLAITTPRREVLTGARTYYVRTDGSDSNDGLANTSGKAFLTLQKAVDVVASLDTSIYQVTIQVGNGTYTTGVTLKQPVGALPPILLGNVTTPASCVISTTNAYCVNAIGPAINWELRGFKLTSAGSLWPVVIENGALLHVNGPMELGATPSFHYVVGVGSTLKISASYTISAGGLAHFNILSGGILYYDSLTVTLTGSPAWSTAFIMLTSLAIATTGGVTFSGATTGKRFQVNANSVIDTFGAGINYFPGTVPGTQATGGQYA